MSRIELCEIDFVSHPNWGLRSTKATDTATVSGQSGRYVIKEIKKIHDVQRAIDTIANELLREGWEPLSSVRSGNYLMPRFQRQEE